MIKQFKSFHRFIQFLFDVIFLYSLDTFSLPSPIFRYECNVVPPNKSADVPVVDVTAIFLLN